MGFFKNLFGNKPEDDASATSEPDREQAGDSTTQPAETKPEPPPRTPESRVENKPNSADSTASQKVPTPAADRQKTARTNDKIETSTNPERRPADGPPPLNNVVQFKSVSVSSAPPTEKQHKPTPPRPPKRASRNDAAIAPGRTESRETPTQEAQAKSPTHSTEKKSAGVGDLSTQKSNGIEQAQTRAARETSNGVKSVSQSKAKSVGARQTPPKTPKVASQSLKEKLMATADSAVSSRNGIKSKTEARVFRTAMMQAKQKSIPPKEPELDLRSAVEWAFEPTSQSNDAVSREAKTVLEDDSKRDEIQQIFSEIVTSKAGAIRDFALELSLGLTPKTWIGYCRKTVEAIAHAAALIKSTELADALVEFERRLDQANQQLGPSINPSLISELDSGYATLAEQMPQGFAVGETPVTRERLLVESLLLQVPGVGRKIVKQIESKQLGKYRDLCTADADEMARRVDIDETVAKTIVEIFSAFQRDREAIEPDRRIENALRKLGALCQELEQLHREFCQADLEDDSESKRHARRSQALNSAQIDVILADIAEFDLLRRLRPLPVQKKIAAITTFVDETASQLSAAHESSPASKKVSG